MHERKPLGSKLTFFFIVTFLFTWFLLGLAVLSANGWLPLALPATVMITLATLGPALGAIAAAFSEAGRDGVRALLAQARRWRVAPPWYLAALGGPALVIMVGFLLWLMLGGSPPPAPPAMTWLSVPVLLLVMLVPALFEEIGWRGYALPRLQARFGWVASSLILGVIWAVWHAPIWFIPEAGFSTLPFPYFLLFTLALSLLFTWLYNGTGGSVLIPALAHAALNAYPLPWNTAVFLLPRGARGPHLQIPVALVLAAAAIVLVLVKVGRRHHEPDSRIRHWLLRGLFLLGLVLVTLPLLGAAYQAIATRADARHFPPPGQLVDVGGYKMHIYCQGEGSPTVVLDALFPGTVSNWVWVQPQVAEATRVCAYDRAGLGWSESGPERRDALQHARELHTLLQNADIPGPYVLVGHSLGALSTRMFADQYPEEVAGIVLVEGTDPDTWQRLGIPEGVGVDRNQLAVAPILARLGVFRLGLISAYADDPDLPPQQRAELRAFFNSSKSLETVGAVDASFSTALDQVRQARNLGAKPLAIVLGSEGDGGQEALRELFVQQAELSSNSITHMVEGATHAGLVDNEAHAVETATVILQVVEAARTDEPLVAVIASK